MKVFKCYIILTNSLSRNFSCKLSAKYVSLLDEKSCIEIIFGSYLIF